MKEFIKIALSEAFIKLEKQTPQTKKETKSLRIMDVPPLKLLAFMKDNDVPDDAYFNGNDNGYDAYDDFLISWDIDVPTTDKDKLIFKRRRFSDIAHSVLYPLLTSNGYKKCGFSSGLLRDFDDTTVYDMFVSEDFDRLVKYYSLSFKKEENV